MKNEFNSIVWQGLQIVYKKRFETAALVLTCWGLALRALCLLRRELWVDEVFSLSCITGPIKPLLWKLDMNGEQICFPGYYYLTWPFVQIFKTNKWGINISHIAITILGFYFFYLLCRRHIKFFIPFLIAFAMLVFNNNLVYHAFEFRPYAVLPTLAIGILFFSDRLMEGAYQTLGKKALLLLCVVLTVVYHAYGMLIVAIVFGYLLVRNMAEYRTQRWKDFFGFYALAFCITLPIFFWYASGTVWADHTRDVFQFIANPAVNGVQFVKDVFGNLTGHPIGLKALFLLGTLAIFVGTQAQKTAYFTFIGFLIIIPIELILVSDLQKGYWFLQRQFVWTMPYFAFLVGWMWDGIFQRSSQCFHSCLIRRL